MEHMSDPTTVVTDELDGCGTVRSHYLSATCGIEVVADVAEASIDELTRIRSVGETTAGRLKGRAQGIVSAWEDMAEEVSPDGDIETADEPTRIAVLFGSVPDEERPSVQKLRRMVGEAIEDAGITVRDEMVIGYVKNEDPSDDVSEAGGQVVEDWVDWQRTTGTFVSTKEVITPWEKYAHYCDWGYTPDGDPPPRSSIPFSTPRGGADVEPWMATAERTKILMEWADHAVIPLDGQYADRIREAADTHDVPHSTLFEVDRAGDLQFYSPPPEPEQVDIDEQETITGRTGTVVKPKTDDDGNVVRDDDGDAVLEEEKVMAEDYRDSKEWRAGSPAELDPDADGVTIGVEAQDEHWPARDDDNPGGGIGKRSDREGKYITDWSA